MGPVNWATDRIADASHGREFRTATGYLCAGLSGAGRATSTPMHEGVRGQHPGMRKPGDPRRVQTPHPRLSVAATIGYGAFLAGPAIIGFVGDSVGALRALTVVEPVSALTLLVVPTARPLRSEAEFTSKLGFGQFCTTLTLFILG
jgi:hypothetical protein